MIGAQDKVVNELLIAVSTEYRLIQLGEGVAQYPSFNNLKRNQKDIRTANGQSTSHL